MTLAGALAEHEGALRASMQAAYGLRLLRGGRTEPARTLTEVCDYVAHLPHGCALWIETGGPLALSEEALLLRETVYRLDGLLWNDTEQKGPKPERIPFPRPAAEMRAEQREHHDRMATKARKAARRQGRQPTT